MGYPDKLGYKWFEASTKAPEPFPRKRFGEKFRGKLIPRQHIQLSMNIDITIYRVAGQFLFWMNSKMFCLTIYLINSCLLTKGNLMSTNSLSSHSETLKRFGEQQKG
jgi:hypothetical protein